MSVEGSLSKRSDSHDEWERKSEGGKAKGAKFEKKNEKELKEERACIDAACADDATVNK